MTQVIGRENEKEILREALASRQSELIAVYGRRRVGKTFLIRECLKKHIVFEITGLSSGGMKDQIANFTKEIANRQKSTVKTKKIRKPKTWLEAFSRMEAYLNGKRISKTKKVIFIDEFPWIATPKSGFLTAFENFWNSYCSKRPDIVVVICGSSASYMVKNIIRNKKGLYNRISRKIRLLPFNLRETQLFLRSRGIRYTEYDIVQLYMILGGIPHYLEKLRKGMSIAQNIDRLFFERNGAMQDEFKQLYASLFDDSNRHITLIRTLATVNSGMTRNELLKKSGLGSGGDFSHKLEDLIESGFVNEYKFYRKKIQQTLYRLTDEYSKFYLKFIDFQTGNAPGTWLRLTNSQSFRSWAGFAFETICLKHIVQIKYSLRIDKIYSIDSTWFNSEAQADLLIDRDDNIINLCEIKFYNNSFSIDKSYYLQLKNKINALRKSTQTRKNIHLTFITAFGLKENDYSRELVYNYIDMHSLFAF